MVAQREHEVGEVAMSKGDQRQRFQDTLPREAHSSEVLCNHSMDPQACAE